MPHQCVRCGKFHEDGSKDILTGCSCGGRLFFFIKKEKFDEIKAEKINELSSEQRFRVEQDIMNMIGDKKNDDPVVLDLENVRVVKPGTYELDIVQLFRNKPLIFKFEDGRYIIDLGQTFQSLRRR